MTWHIDLVASDALEALLARIQRAAGTVASCRRQGALIRVTWTTRG